MGFRLTLIIACALCCTAFCEKSRAQESRALKERFLDEAPRAWEEFHTRARRLQGSFRLEATFEGKATGREREEFRQADGFALVLHQSLFPERGDVGGTQRVANPKYGFALRRGDEAKSWAVSQVEMVRDKGHPLAPVFADVERWADAPITLYMVSDLAPEERKGALAVMIKEPGFSLQKVTAHDRGPAKEWAKIEFTYRPNGESARVPSLVTGWAVLDPERGWSIQEDQYGLEWAQSQQTAIFASKFQYQEATGPFPILSRIEMTHIYPKTSKQRRLTFEFALREAGAPAEDFTLSAFGFPEPVGVSWPKPTRWWLWIFAAAVALLLLPIAALTLKRRFTRQTPAATGAKEGGP